jgi:hypothetical protein
VAAAGLPVLPLGPLGGGRGVHRRAGAGGARVRRASRGRGRRRGGLLPRLHRRALPWRRHGRPGARRGGRRDDPAGLAHPSRARRRRVVHAGRGGPGHLTRWRRCRRGDQQRRGRR